MKLTMARIISLRASSTLYVGE